MSNPQVNIVRLEAMRMISFTGFGQTPEDLAYTKLNAWAQAHNQHGRVFGFNNPNPSAGSPNYGYEVWMSVGADVQPEGEARIVDFPGGLYAVLRCPVVKPWDDIPAAWQQLVKWLDASQYSHAEHQWLEENFNSEAGAGAEMFTLDLYLPIR